MQPTHLHNLTSVQYQSRCRTCCSSVAQPLTFSSLQITDCCFQPCLRINFILSVSSRPSHSRSHSSHLAHDTSVTISCLLTAHFWLTTHFPQDCLWTWSKSPMLNLMSPSCIHWPWFPKNKISGWNILKFLSEPFAKRFALCYQTIVLSVYLWRWGIMAKRLDGSR